MEGEFTEKLEEFMNDSEFNEDDIKTILGDLNQLKKDFNISVTDGETEDEEEKELTKWHRRWALEDIKEMTTNCDHTLQEAYKEMYETLEGLHVITDPEFKDYIKEKDIKNSQKNVKPCKDVSKQDNIQINSIEGQKQFPIDKIFGNVNKIETSKSSYNALMNSTSSIVNKNLTQMKNMNVNETLRFLSLQVDNRFAENNEDILEIIDKRTLLEGPDIKIDYTSYTKQVYKPQLHQILEEAEEFIKKGDEILAEISKEFKNGQNNTENKFFA